MEKTFGQKIAMAIAVLCYIAGVGCAVGAALYPVRGAYDAIQASLMASVVFFVGCGIVLHVIATTRLKGIVTLDKSDADKR
ncbi:hypothetical protein [Sulfurisoma sediminicola]|jgi:hypothetical protein|uniref:Uncharacterized protein n=1 Tax=Sulfurisoma sediminicola TaxID=1381557 RepID=A0A497X991_9PROT|nr:hypothetical protein [Sulfurisoma sediminicola]RLJ62770.1 hypothetical protein DFR35_2587 [Sulfurisoma sediminicola]